MVNADLIVALLSPLLAGGLVLGLLKLRPDNLMTIGSANERAMKSLLTSMDVLEDRLHDAERREHRLINDMAALRLELAKLRNELAKRASDMASLRVERDVAKAELARMRRKLGDADGGLQ